MNPKIDLSKISPPLAPTPDEQLAKDELSLAEASRKEAGRLAKGRVRWDAELVTRSEKWGLIWRADFSEPDRQPPISPTRVMRWKGESGSYSLCVSVGRHEPLRLAT